MGHVLIIPSSSDDHKIVKEKRVERHKVSNNNSSGTKIHIVKEDDAIESIAKKYGIKEKELLAWNNLKFKQLKVASKLIVDEPDFLKPYVVKKGDSLSKLALDFDISVENIIRLNSLEDQNLIIGQKLYLKKASGDINFHYVRG